MSLSNDAVPFTMPVQPANSGSNCGSGGWGGDWGAWIILFLIFGMFGWGGMGGFGGFGGLGMGGGYPTEAILQRSLDTQTIIGKLDGVNQGLCDGFYAQNNAINGLGMNTMQGFHGVDNAICGLGSAMQQGFNSTNVVALQNQNALQAQLSDCCCTTQRAIDSVNYNLASQSCDTRNAIQNSTRDIIDSQNSGFRAILDKMCQQELAAKDAQIAAQNQRIFGLELTASQANQNNVIGARIDAATAEILRRTGNDCPVNAVVVQPNTPVQFPTNCCGQAVYGNNGWGNGCGSCCA